MARSKILLGRILRNLKNHGIVVSDIQDTEIYGELTTAQDVIIRETQPEALIKITFKEGIDEYPLTTETVTDPTLNYNNDISAIKVVKSNSNFKVVSNVEFVNLIKIANAFGDAGSNLISNFASYFKTGKSLEGVKNNLNKIFTIPDSKGIVRYSEEIFYNGIPIKRITDYTITDTTITLIDIIPSPTDYLTANWITNNYYIKSSELSGNKNGSNRIFKIPEDYGVALNSEKIYLNGVYQIRNIDYAISGNIVTILHNILPLPTDEYVAIWITDNKQTQSIKTPSIATIINNKLKVYPKPDLSIDGSEIELIVYRKTSTKAIDDNNEPEIGEEFDKALEYYVTAQFLIGDARNLWQSYYEREIAKIAHLTHKGRGTISRPMIEGLW